MRALDAAIELADGRVDGEAVAFARHVAEKAGQRLIFGSEHTIVALLGSTGAGKSSIANALVGSDVATTGVRRPTTSSSMAFVWGDDDATPLLDWLEVDNRHLVGADTALDGLVLLDVPDHDSVAVAHRLEMERIAEHTDLMVWVTDPEKYADAALHHYLRYLGAHGAIVLVVLNKIDRLSEDDRAACRADLERLLEDDGLSKPQLLDVSAMTGAGIDGLADELRHAIERQDAAVARLEADLTVAAGDLQALTGNEKIGDIARRIEKEIATGLVDATGIETVAAAVGAGHRRDAAAATGWPFTRWIGRLRPHPLRRLHLGRESAGRSSLPSPSAAQSARAESVIRDAADAVSRDLTPPWPALIRAAAMPDPPTLADRLDRAVGDIAREQGARSPRWWSLIGTLQIGLAVAAIVGALWLVAIAGVAWLQLPDLPTPEIRGIPIPTGMLIGGAAIGWLLAVLSRRLASIGAKRRAAATKRRAIEAVSEVADDLIMAPMRDELGAHDALVEQLAIVAAS